MKNTKLLTGIALGIFVLTSLIILIVGLYENTSNKTQTNDQINNSSLRLMPNGDNSNINEDYEENDEEDDTDSDNAPALTNNVNVTLDNSKKTYSLFEVQKHTSASDCWTIVSGKIYDVSGYDAQHPGGAYKITSFCGKDMTRAFDNQHSVSNRAGSVLDSFFIGNLA